MNFLRFSQHIDESSRWKDTCLTIGVRIFRNFARVSGESGWQQSPPTYSSIHIICNIFYSFEAKFFQPIQVPSKNSIFYPLRLEVNLLLDLFYRISNYFCKPVFWSDIIWCNQYWWQNMNFCGSSPESQTL